MEIPEKPIAAGRTAEIYAWGEGRVLKLLRPGFPADLIQQEEAVTRAITQAGIPAPKIYEVLETGGRPGIVYERVYGPSLLEKMRRSPARLREHAALLAKLHAAIHAHTFSPAPEGAARQKLILARQVESAEVLPATLRQAVLDLLDTLPGGDTLCHNDFHPLNVLLGPGGGGEVRPVIIDWESASLGSACADVARTTLTWGLARPPGGFPNIFAKIVSGWYQRAFTSAYLASYRSLTANPLADLRAWQAVQAAAKVQWEAPASQAVWLAVIYRGMTNNGR